MGQARGRRVGAHWLEHASHPPADGGKDQAWPVRRLQPASGLAKQAPTQLEGGLVVIKAEDLGGSYQILGCGTNAYNVAVGGPQGGPGQTPRTPGVWLPYYQVQEGVQVAIVGPIRPGVQAE